MSDQHDLALILQSRAPLVIVETGDEARLLELLTRIAVSTDTARYRPLFRWSITDGLQRLDLELEPQRHNTEPADVLGQIRAVTKPGIYVLLDFHPFLNDPVHTRLLKDIAIRAEANGTVVVFVSHEVRLPPELKSYSVRFELSLPDADARRRTITRLAEEYRHANTGSDVRIDAKALDLLVTNLSGLSHADVERLARNAIFDDGALDSNDVPQVMKAKYQLLNAGGVLTYDYETEKFADVAGFGNLKRWLQQRRAAFGSTPPPGLDPPRGVLLLGVQGCGKSLAAKATAAALGVPLLRLDFGALYNKFHGETERNLRESLATAELMGPCVLWLDEIEKGLAARDHGESGTSQRVLGTLLTWMAERPAGVLLVATANDISALPPELVRKGRFDEIFFVDLPDPRQRVETLVIHLRRRGLEPASFDLAPLAAASDGFSGAEIEQGIVAALYAAHAADEAPSTRHVRQEFERTKPLSVLMCEQVAALREWARTRTVPAD